MADTAAPGPTRALILANPASGSHSPELVGQVRDLCATYLERAEVHRTSGPGTRPSPYAAPWSAPTTPPT